MQFLFEKLDVYNLALDFQRKIIRLCSNNRFKGYRYLLDQLQRSSLSISLNIAEGDGRSHK